MNFEQLHRKRVIKQNIVLGGGLGKRVGSTIVDIIKHVCITAFYNVAILTLKI